MQSPVVSVVVSVHSELRQSSRKETPGHQRDDDTNGPAWTPCRQLLSGGSQVRDLPGARAELGLGEKPCPSRRRGRRPLCRRPWLVPILFRLPEPRGRVESCKPRTHDRSVVSEARPLDPR